MQSERTFKSSNCIDGKNMTLSMEIQNILLKVFKCAENILQEACLQSLSKIIDEIGVIQQNSLKCVQSVLFLMISQIQQLRQKNTVTVHQNDYIVLQQSLQKAQSEVRKHIRIEQQLKLYLDGLEEKNQNLEKQLKIQQNKYHQLFESMKIMDHQKKELTKKYKKLQQRNKYLTDRQKLKGHKSAKLISQSLNRVQTNYSVSMYKSKPILTSNHHHSKSKTSEKSFQKQKKQIVIGLQRKGSKLKHLHEQIKVDIQKPSYYQSKQQKKQKSLYDQPYIPTQQDIRIFKQMTKTVQMKQAYKRPVRKVTKYKTQSKQGKQLKDVKNSASEFQNRQYRSVSMYK